MTEIESLVAGFKSDVALAVGQHRRIVGAGNVGNFCKSIDFHRQRYGAKLEGLRHQGFDGAEIDAAAAQIAQLANDAIDRRSAAALLNFIGGDNGRHESAPAWGNDARREIIQAGRLPALAGKIPRRSATLARPVGLAKFGVSGKLR